MDAVSQRTRLACYFCFSGRTDNNLIAFVIILQNAGFNRASNKQRVSCGKFGISLHIRSAGCKVQTADRCAIIKASSTRLMGINSLRDLMSFFHRNNLQSRHVNSTKIAEKHILSISLGHLWCKCLLSLLTFKLFVCVLRALIFETRPKPFSY